MVVVVVVLRFRVAVEDGVEVDGVVVELAEVLAVLAVPTIELAELPATSCRRISNTFCTNIWLRC